MSNDKKVELVKNVLGALVNTPTMSANLANQTVNARNIPKQSPNDDSKLDALAVVGGTLGNIASWGGNMADLAGASNASKFAGGVGALLSSLQVINNLSNEDGDFSKLSASDALVLLGAGMTGAIAIPSLGGIAVVLGAGTFLVGASSATLGLFDNLYGKLTLGDVADYWQDKFNDWFGDQPPPQTPQEWEEWLKDPVNRAKWEEWMKDPNNVQDWMNKFGNPQDWREMLDNGDSSWTNNPYRKVRGYQIVDPVILDLDGDGIETLAHAKNKGAMFDFDGDGLKNATGWVKSDDGILVFDRNGDGLINDGREIFGDSTVKSDGTTAKHGFDALADLDSNKDGKITAEDVDFAKLKVWQDKNQDGISQADELKTLAEHGITALNLNYQDTNETLAGDNQLAQRSSYEKADGSTFTMGDVNFRFDTFYSQYIEKTPVSDDIKALPNLAGSGRVRSLHEAMQRSENLKHLVEKYIKATSKEEQQSMLYSLMRAWANASDKIAIEEFFKLEQGDFVAQAVEVKEEEKEIIWVTPQQAEEIRKAQALQEKINAKFNAVSHKISLLNAFYGTNIKNLYYGTEEEANQAIKLINTSYESLETAIYTALYGQGGAFAHYLQKVLMDIYVDEQQKLQVKLNLNPLVEHFKTLLAENKKSAFVDMVEFLSYFQQHNQLETLHLDEFVELLSNTYNSLSASTQQNYLAGVEKPILDKGMVKFGTSSDDHLTGSIVIAGQGNDRVYGTDKHDYLTGGNGNDYLEANDGNDKLNGGAGDDTLYGESGEDTLIGGVGNDYLDGGYGVDSYIFSKGHGQDTVYDYDWTVNDGVRPQDKIIFTDVRSDEIRMMIDGYDLIITGYHEDDKVVMKNFQHGENYHIEQFQFADKTLTLSNLMEQYTLYHQGNEQGANQSSTYWIGEVSAELGAGDDTFTSASNGKSIVVDSGLGDDRIYTGVGHDRIVTGDGNDYVEARDGNDTIDGGAGNDTLYGESGEDTLIGGIGNDYLDGGYGADRYIFSKGHGQDTVYDYDWAFNDGVRPQDKIIFTDIRSDEIRLMIDGYDLIITGYHEDDKVVMKNFQHGENYHIEQFQFADKTLTLSDLMAEYTLYHQGSEASTSQDSTYWTGKVNAQLGAGNDTFSTARNAKNVTVDGGLGDDHIYTGIGNDNIVAGDGNDYVEARDGNDTIDGGAGNDTLYGESGEDTLIGGLGRDTLYGGSGADTFVFSLADALDAIENQADYIADFNIQQGDKLDLRGLLQDDTQNVNIDSLLKSLDVKHTEQSTYLTWDRDGIGEQYQAETILEFSKNTVENIEQLISSQSIIL